MELDFVIQKTVFRSKITSKQEENSADLPILLYYFIIGEIMIYG